MQRKYYGTEFVIEPANNALDLFGRKCCIKLYSDYNFWFFNELVRSYIYRVNVEKLCTVVFFDLIATPSKQLTAYAMYDNKGLH